MMTGIIFLKILMLFGLGIWLFIAALNNFIDPETNAFIIHDMMRMEQLKADVSVMGNALLWRIIDNKQLVFRILMIIAMMQLLCAISLFLSGVLMLLSQFASGINDLGLFVSNLSLCGFCGIWLFFVCGGLWFAYWIKFPFAQTTHFILLLIGLLTAILVNT